jgi:hypothetical protein
MVGGNPDAAHVLATLADASVPDETKRRVYAQYRAKYGPQRDDASSGSESQAAD